MTPEPLNTYRVTVKQKRRKSLDVKAKTQAEAEQKVREMLGGDYGGWTYGQVSVSSEILGPAKSNYRPHPCPFCRQEVTGIEQVEGALYKYEGCGCEVQFTADGYPRKPRK